MITFNRCGERLEWSREYLKVYIYKVDDFFFWKFERSFDESKVLQLQDFNNPSRSVDDDACNNACNELDLYTR